MHTTLQVGDVEVRLHQHPLIYTLEIDLFSYDSETEHSKSWVSANLPYNSALKLKELLDKEVPRLREKLDSRRSKPLLSSEVSET